MKKLRAVKLKTTFISRSGKRSVYVPVNVVKKTAEKKSETKTTCSSTSEVLLDEPTCELSIHQRRQVFSFNNWEKIRQSVIDAFMEECSLTRTACSECNAQPAKIRCQECGPRQFFCEQCAVHLHLKRNQFHLLEIWKDEMFAPFYVDHGIIGYGHNCPTKVLRNFTLVDSSGIQHFKHVEVCDCEPYGVSLVRCNFWPGSPVKPTTAFHISLMNLLEKLFLQCQVSLYDFSEVLDLLQPQLGKTVRTSLYGILNSGCFEEFRQFKYHMQHLHSFCPGLTNGTQCQLCPEDEGVLIESLDACMGLTRKKKKGGGLVEPRHKELMFSDQTDIDNFVDNYGKEGTKIEENCNRFHAGEVLLSLRSKGKNKLFDEKGVFGRVCRHDFPKSFVNLKYGERISYSIYEINKLKESLKDKPGVKLVIMYDIACILASHLKCTNQENLIENIDLAIPIFHCYGHKASCQIEYNPRRIAGVGLTDGEGVERLWSYLRGYSSMTKEMSSEKRIDVLTDALIFYGQRLHRKFGRSLKDKLLKAKDLAVTVENDIKDIEATLSYPCTEEVIKQWKTAEFTDIKPRENVLELLWDEKYVDTLLEVQMLSADLRCMDIGQEATESIQNKKKRKEKELVSIEKKYNIKTRWKEDATVFETVKKRLFIKKKTLALLDIHRLASERTFLLEMKKKYADGQSIAIKLSTQISKATKSMEKCLVVFNALVDTSERLTFHEIKDPSNTIFSAVSNETNDEIPQSVRKKIISLYSYRERCEEEVELVKTEMIRLVQAKFAQLQAIRNQCTMNMKPGLKALLLQKCAAIYEDISKLTKQLEGLGVSPYFVEEKIHYISTSNNPVMIPTDEDNDFSNEMEDVDDSDSTSEHWDTDSNDEENNQ